MMLIIFLNVQPSVRKEVTHYMEQGHWFLSLYNDDGDPQEVTFIATVADDMTHNCPNGCSGKGECLMGHCQCNPGFGGDDCSESKSKLKVLCSSEIYNSAWKVITMNRRIFVNLSNSLTNFYEHMLC